MLTCPHCTGPKQLDRPCQRCGFAGVGHNVATFMILPDPSLVDEASRHAAQVAEAMLVLHSKPQETRH